MTRIICLDRACAWLRAAAARFRHDESGITLPLLGLALVGLTSFTGIAVDVGRMQMLQARLQSSLDSAGLAGGSTISTAALQSETQKYLNVNFNGYMGATVTGFSVVANASNTVFTLSATATLPTTFMSIAGIKTITVNATSQVTRAITGLELVLVLDNTGSMAQSAGGTLSKIQALQQAATTMVQTVFASAQPGLNNLWVGIVPFSQAVNIGTSHPAWINNSYTYDGTTKPLDWGPGGSWMGCVDARQSGEDIVDDPPVSTSAKTLFGSYYWTSDNLNTDGISNAGYNNWKTPHVSHGVTTYTYASPLNDTNKGPNLLCPQQVTPMTNTATTLYNAINAMTAQGDTLINQGMIWGWNMLSPRWQGLWGGTMNSNGLPLAYNTPNMAKAIVLVTDGENTIDNTAHGAYWFLGSGRAGSANSGTATDDLTSKTLAICTAMKNNGIYIYTVGLGTNGGINTAELQSCATAVNYYFASPTTDQLNTIFSQIGDSLSNLRVSH